MKRIIAITLLLCLLLCACGEIPQDNGDSSKLSIVCSSFPAFDFAREISGGKADIKLLIKPGAEVHSYEPTPKDVIRIRNCDLFICNGGESEEWVEELISDDLRVIRMMDCVETVAEEVKDGMYVRGGEEGEEEELDEHVWTSPMNALLIVKEIAENLCEADPANAAYYNAKATSYMAQLISLDSDIRRTVSGAEHKTLIFADRFPMRYFTKEYGLDYYAAFPGCASETEPSAKTVAFLIDRVREDNIPAVLYMEFSNEKMADVICEDTGCVKLPFFSAHNISAEQFEAGMTYLDLMRINLNSLKEALS